jgi:acyl-CoA dehydrogenase
MRSVTRDALYARGPGEIALSSDDLSPFYEEHHRLLGASLRRSLGRDLGAGAARRDDVAHVAAAMGAELGLYSFLVPEALGGAAMGRPEDPTYVDVRALCLVREGLGQLHPTADSIFAVQGLGSYPITIAGTDALRRSVMPEVVKGTRIGAFALTEPEAGSDVASMRTTATKDDAGWKLDGEKVYISNVGIADHYVVFANADPSLGKKGISTFVVPKDAPGLELSPIALAMAHPLGRVRMTGCRLPQEALLGEVGAGLSIALRTLETFRITVGAAAAGIARRALDLAIAHVTTRVQFGAPLAELQQVQAMIADMATELDAARLLVARAAWARDRAAGTAVRTTTETAMAKMFATEHAQTIVDRALQLHGGRGIEAESEIWHLYQEVRALRIYEGATEVQKVVIARALLR